MKQYQKIVLAYSGGLDTSVIIPWLKAVSYTHLDVYKRQAAAIVVDGNDQPIFSRQFRHGDVHTGGVCPH